MTSERIRRLPLTEGWAMWSVSGLRSAGMPAARALPGPGQDAADHLRDAVADPWFVEAVAWQNADLVRTWLGPKHRAARAGEDLGKLKQERILAAYLQRYATKNDTIGFFGPSGSAQWTVGELATPLHMRPGEELLRERRVCFEPWALERLVAAWAERPQLRWHMPVVRNRSSSLVGNRLYRNDIPLMLTDLEAAIHRLADGKASAAGIFEATAARHGSDQESFCQTLTSLDDRRVVSWAFFVPLDHEPEQTLRAQIHEISDEAVRKHFLADLDALDEARAVVRAAAGDPLALADAMAGLDALFSELTGANARRRSPDELGRGRSVLYMDAWRDVSVRIGDPLRQALAGPLGLVLSSVRWLTASLAEYVRAELRTHLEQSGGQQTPFFLVYRSLEKMLSVESGFPLRRLLSEVESRWATALGASPEDQRVQLEYGDLAPRVCQSFHADDYGWAAARHHAPDVMLAVRDADESGPKDFLWVLGEIHIAINTLENRSFVAGYPDPDALRTAIAEDYVGGRVLPAFPRGWPMMSQRSYPPPSFDVPERYRYWAVEEVDTLPVDRVPTPGADLWLEERDGHLRALAADGSLDVDAVEALGEFLSWAIAERFSLLPREWSHVPRVTVDRFVLQRETWRVPATRLVADPVAHLAALGVPRHGFVQAPGEVKPFLFDQESRPLLRQLRRVVRRSLERDPSAVVSISEMLPDFDQLWLQDAQGRQYTAEFRLVTVDLAPHQVVVE